MISVEIDSLLLLLGFSLAFIHFTVPLTYYLYLKRRWLWRPWNIKRDPGYKPRVTVIVPTYNEARLINKKLDDLARQNYPRELLEILVIDSASIDGTVEKVEEWVRRNNGLRIHVLRESVRRGKAYALNNALKHADGEIVVITDVDATWGSENTLSEALSWFSDPGVGAVTCLKQPANKGSGEVEEGYREFYNIVRLAESKAYSTPVFHGELAVFRKELLEKIGGFPTDIGADDSHTATRIALMGYRSIAANNIICIEKVPHRGYHDWRIRRAQHLVQHFIKTLGLLRRAPRIFKPTLIVETLLHLVNPWLLLASILILLYLTATNHVPAIIFLVLGASLLILKPFRTWVATQTYLIAASLRNMWTKEIVWRKQEKR